MNSEERDAALGEFVAWVVAHVRGDEKGQAQIFLDRLFVALGHKGCLDVGGQTEFRIRKPQEDGGGTAFADYVWKPFVLIEMKKRGEDLARHYRQAFDYWVRLAPGRPRYVVLCNFDQFWVYDFETQMDTPVDQLPLVELPTRWGPLAFLFPSHDRPVFGNDQEQVTRDAADKLAECFNKLITRHVPRDTAQRFALQMLVALFAEDIGLLPKYFVTRLLEDCKSRADSYDLLGGLFEAMNSPQPLTGGRFKGVEYFNGGLFEIPARIELRDDELAQLREAAKKDWSKVRPEIFGALFEHSLEKTERHAYGGHFTHPTDIMKIVGPTIVEPWRARIENASSARELTRLHDRMRTYRVLDPACGSGNFLYIAYREMKRLELRLVERLGEIRKGEKGQRRPGRLRHCEPVLWHGHQPIRHRDCQGDDDGRPQAGDRRATRRGARLSLDNLDANFIAGDALLTPLRNGGIPIPTMLFAELEEDPWSTGKVVRTEWPMADVIIGNPPFLDARKTTVERGRQYVSYLERLYPEISRRADYCTYWIRMAQDHLPECSARDPVAGRAGLVGTQNIRSNEAREGGLDYVTRTATIIEAVESQPWSGEASVHVSIVNWVKTQKNGLLPSRRRLWRKVDPPAERKKIRKRAPSATAKEYELAPRLCRQINSALSDEIDLSAARVLSSNTASKRCFEGLQPGHKGFRITAAEFARITKLMRACKEVLFPYMNGSGLLSGRHASRPEYLIDFGRRKLLAASAFAPAFQLVQDRVLPAWSANAKTERVRTGRRTGEHQRRYETWWLLKRRRSALIREIERLPRYVVCSRVTKRPVFVFLSSKWRPDSSLTAFVFSDDYSFGVLQSAAHWRWFVAKCSKLTERFRYTPESVFDTFPWPQSPTSELVQAVAEAGRIVRRLRSEALRHTRGGLRAVYRALELPGDEPLKDAQAALDAALLDAYGFTPRSDLLAKLLDLNRSVARRIDRREPVTPPGVPPGYPTPADLVTEDCMRPDHT